MKKLVCGAGGKPFPIWQVAAQAAARQLEDSFKRIGLADSNGWKRPTTSDAEGEHGRSQSSGEVDDRRS